MIATFILMLSSPSSSLKREEAIKNIQTLTTLPWVVNSTPFLEKRIRVYDDFSNRLYPKMNKSTYGNFVYAK